MDTLPPRAACVCLAKGPLRPDGKIYIYVFPSPGAVPTAVMRSVNSQALRLGSFAPINPGIAYSFSQVLTEPFSAPQAPQAKSTATNRAEVNLCHRGERRQFREWHFIQAGTLHK